MGARILIVEDDADINEIIEDGTHAELTAADGEYAALWDRQTGAFLDGK